MRYEFKYIVHESKIESLRQMVLPFVNVDKFAELELNKPFYLNNEGVFVTISDVLLKVLR